MIVGLGIDLVDMDRIRVAYNKYGLRFLGRFLTDNEIEAALRKPPSYIAGRFAAKEAAVKALGTGFSQGITPRQIETFTNNLDKPGLRFFGPAKSRALELGMTRAHISISHERRMAVSLVILED